MNRKPYFLVPIWLLFATTLFAQNGQKEYSLKTPYHTLNTHFEYLSEDNHHPDVAAKVINPAHATGKKAEQIATKIMQVYKGEGIIIDLETVPNVPDYYDSISEERRYYVTKKFPDIYLERISGKWYYSKNTIENINEVHRSVYPFGVDKLLNLLPKLGTKRIIGLHVWQALGMVFIIIFTFAIHFLFTFLLQKIIIGMLLRQGYDRVVDQFVGPIAKPISILIIYPILMLLVPVLQFDMKINYYVMTLLKATWPIFATIVFYKIVDIIGLYLKKLADKTESTLDDQLVPIIRKVLKIFVIIVGGLAILSNLNVDIIPLLTGLSIGGLAFALAAQDTLKNFFGSIMIFIDKPFQIGDWITSGEIDGTVEEVGFRATRIRTFRNSVTYVPNARIADSMIDNHGLRQFRRFYTQITVTYDTPPEVIEAFVEGLREIVEKHPNTRKDYYNVYLNDLASHSINIMFYIFFKVPDWPGELKARHEVLLSIIRLAETLGVSFAFPTQTLHMETFPEKIPNSPTYEKDTSVLRARIDEFFKGSGSKN